MINTTSMWKQLHDHIQQDKSIDARIVGGFVMELHIEMDRLQRLEAELDAEIERLDKLVNHAHRNRVDGALASLLSAYNTLDRIRSKVNDTR